MDAAMMESPHWPRMLACCGLKRNRRRPPGQLTPRRRLVHRRQDGAKSFLQLRSPIRAGMRENVTFVFADCGKNLRGDIGWIEPCLPAFGEFGGQPAGRARAVRYRHWTITF